VSSSTTEQLVDIVLPAIGTSMTEGTVVAWLKEVGDTVARDENVCEISSDKVDIECPSPVTGRLFEVLVHSEQTVDVGTVLGRIAVSDVRNAPVKSPAGDAPAVSDAPTVPGDGDGSEPGNGPTADDGDMGGTHVDGSSKRYTPVVMRMAEAHDLDLSGIAGSGRNGRVTKRDVLAYLKVAQSPSEVDPPLHSESPYVPDPTPAPGPDVMTPSATPASDVALAASGGPRQLSRMRQSIGRAMRHSLATAATCTTVVECDMSAVERTRAKRGVTALPIVAVSLVDTLRDFPELNATLDETGMTLSENVHLGVAVSLGEDGLVVPVIRDAQNLSAEGFSRQIRAIARRARAKDLTPDDFAGATFTITSPGAYGALMATPIINIPQVGILDMEAITRRAVVVADDRGNESIAIRSMTYFCLSWDRRAIDGVYAAQFLTALRRRVETTT
jgi:pyruvate/2-oxoglutarate dehydrogenase complex dihydrolipoamide acyltransferase (E2) component